MSEQEQKNLIEYIIACISEFADYHALSQKESFNYLYKFKGISFLKEHYNIEHTLSIEDAVNDLTMICNKNGGSI
ncbi:MAG: DUF3791 domain-containing protein [Candidatus Riflebacteria bacterium]|nr:DUF3791 domain-containing protein [Candidatus Riflebacteria bacterium]MBR4571205.1 DUF3791 domain-containing protein [Candidatus Riflebacteria bacterium]